MPQPLTFVLVHVVWSTKGRRPWLREAVRPGLHASLTTVARGVARGDCFRVGGVEDHVHLAVRVHATVGVARVVQEVKRCSSTWMRAHGPEFACFRWQRGYGAFPWGRRIGGVVPVHRGAGGAPPGSGVPRGDARVFREVPCGVR